MSLDAYDRIEIWQKFNGRCAYCGNKIDLEQMQVDHIVPKKELNKDDYDDIENVNPSCRICNHYKRDRSVEKFRELLITLKSRMETEYLINVGKQYGIEKYFTPFGGKFYFEKNMEFNSKSE